jgi:hypothetical protein
MPCLHGGPASGGLRSAHSELELTARSIPCDAMCGSAARARAFGEAVGARAAGGGSGAGTSGADGRAAAPPFPEALVNFGSEHPVLADKTDKNMRALLTASAAAEEAGSPPPPASSHSLLSLARGGGAAAAASSASATGAGGDGSDGEGDEEEEGAGAARGFAGMPAGFGGISLSAPVASQTNAALQAAAVASLAQSAAQGSGSAVAQDAHTLDLPYMPKAQRAFVHQLAAVYGLVSISIGAEPKRFVRLGRRQRVGPGLGLPLSPTPTSSAAAGGSGPGSAAAAAPILSSVGTLLAPGVVVLPSMTLPQAVALKRARLGLPPLASPSAGTPLASGSASGASAAASKRPGTSFAAAASSSVAAGGAGESRGPSIGAISAFGSLQARGGEGGGGRDKPFHPLEPQASEMDPLTQLGCVLHLTGLRRSSRDDDIAAAVLGGASAVSAAAAAAGGASAAAGYRLRRIDEHNALLTFDTRARAARALDTITAAIGRGAMLPFGGVRYWGAGAARLLREGGGSGAAAAAAGGSGSGGAGRSAWGTAGRSGKVVAPGAAPVSTPAGAALTFAPPPAGASARHTNRYRAFADEEEEEEGGGAAARAEGGAAAAAAAAGGLNVNDAASLLRRGVILAGGSGSGGGWGASEPRAPATWGDIARETPDWDAEAW